MTAPAAAQSGRRSMFIDQQKGKDQVALNHFEGTMPASAYRKIVNKLVKKEGKNCCNFGNFSSLPLPKLTDHIHS